MLLVRSQQRYYRIRIALSKNAKPRTGRELSQDYAIMVQPYEKALPSWSRVHHNVKN